MSGTAAVTAKRAIITALGALTGTGGGLEGVQIAYSWPGARAERECVHGGRVEFEHDPAAFRGGGRLPRDETVTVELHIVVSTPGASIEDTDVRAAAIGAVIEETVAADPTLSGQVLFATLAGGDIDHGDNDDGAASVLTYRAAIRTRLT